MPHGTEQLCFDHHPIGMPHGVAVQELQRDHAIEAEVERRPHFAHAARADSLIELVAPLDHHPAGEPRRAFEDHDGPA